MLSQKSDAPLRVVTIGDASVGKTSLTNRLTDGEFNLYETPTIGANYLTYVTTVDNEKIELQVWDTAGQEKFKSLTPIYFRNSAAAVAVFSLTSRQSFEGILHWISLFLEVAGNTSVVYVCGNKCDCVDEIEVPVDEVKQWAKENKFKFFITSAKTMEGVKEMFNSLAVDLMEVYKAKKEPPPTSQTPKEKEKGCC